MKDFFYYLVHPQQLFYCLAIKGIIPMSDKKYIQMLYHCFFEKECNLDSPTTFNEKLQWLKLYNRKSEYTMMVDKYEVKQYVAEKIGSEYIIPTLGVWDKFNDIDYDKLPSQFVLKCTHDSGGVFICKDKSSFDVKIAGKTLNKCLKRNFYYIGREWPYKDVVPRIIAEKYMEDKKDQELRDYKFYCFNGYVKALMIATNRQGEEELCFDYFDENFNHLDMVNHWHPNAAVTPHKPKKFDEMKKLASILSEKIPHVRVDFYEVDGNVFFGEMTFFDMSGFLKIYPDDWEVEWGNLIDLSLVK